MRIAEISRKKYYGQLNWVGPEIILQHSAIDILKDIEDNEFKSEDD